MLSFTFLYASFWRRAVALVLDGIVLALLSAVLLQPFVTWLGFRELNEALKHVPLAVAIVRAYGAWSLVTMAAAWLYFAILESSRWQATIGKKLMGLLVVTRDEGRLDFQRASLRFVLKIVSAMPLGGGFLYALFDARHRALHDAVIRTLVLQQRTEAFAPKESVPVS